MRARWILPILLLVAIGVFGWMRYRPRRLPEAYIADRSATLWSSTAEVRRALGTLRYGERVFVLGHEGDMTEIRTGQGQTGWVELHQLMNPSLWVRSARLLEQTRSMPVQALGHTKTISNLRIEPGRAGARIYQFGRGVPVEILARATAEIPAAPGEGEAGAGEGPQTSSETQPKREDWFLVRRMASEEDATPPGQVKQSAGAAFTGPPVPVAGWVVARFVELDLPQVIRDYTSSADMRVMAWFELNRVPGGSGEVPQYLVAGARGPEGQPCDFTILRVYTWSRARHRYETAYVESNLCGRFAIRVSQTSAGPEFRFAQIGGGNTERVYVMRQTVVRRVRTGESSLAKSRR